MNATRIHVINLLPAKIQEDRTNVLATKDIWEMDTIVKKCGYQIRDVEVLIFYQVEWKLNVILKATHHVVQHMVGVVTHRNIANVPHVSTIVKNVCIMIWTSLRKL